MKSILSLISSLLFIGTFSAFAQLPIKAARTISFTTDEGSNMSLDISPDGKTIVFDLLGDLYTVPSKGGIATQITRGMAVNSNPTWSPNGDRIAHISDASGDNCLSVVDVSTHELQTFEEPVYGLPVWFGTNDWVTTSNPSFRNSLLYHISGRQVKLPTDIYDIIGSSRDGKSIYYKQETEAGRWYIYKHDSNNGSKKLLVELDKKEGEKIKISKDAHWLSFLSREGVSCSLVLIDLSTKGVKVLARWQQSVSANLGNYAFWPDSKKIVIGYGGKIHLIELETEKDEIIPFKAEVKVDMGRLNESTFNVSQDSLQVKYIRSAQSSPDGKHLVFAALNRIYVMDVLSGSSHLLVKQKVSQFHPSISPDGKWIAFVSWSDKEFGQVWKVGLKGENLTQVTFKPAAYYYPGWSPDGKTILVGKGNFWEGKPLLGQRDGPGFGQLLSINLVDRKVKMVSDSVQLISRCTYSRDGESIVFKPYERMNQEKYLISINKRKEKQTIAVAVAPTGHFKELFIRQLYISPDCKFIVYQNEENLHLVPVVPVGVPTLLYDQTQKLPVIRFARGGFDPHWEQGGKALSWSFANKYFRIDPDKIIATAIKLAEKRAKLGLPEPELLDVEIAPDKMITIDLKVPRKIGKGVLALKNVCIITMNGNKVIEKGTILIKNGRFVEIGEHVNIPEGAKIIDLSDKTIIPGLIDLHDHVDPPAEVFPQQKWDFLADLAYGTTTSRDPSGSHDSFGYEETIATGQMIGPRFFNVSHAVRDGLYTNLISLQEALIVVQNRAHMGAVAVKQYALPNRLKRQWLLLACEKAGLNMTNEVRKDMNGFIGHLKDGTSGIEHNPLWGEAYNDVIQLVAKSGVYLTPTLQALFGTQPAKYEFTEWFSKLNPKLARFYPEKEIVRRSLQKLNVNPNEPSFLNHSKIDAAIRKAGGRVTMGSHGEDPGLGAHFEIWALQMGGLTNKEAMESATILAAGALGMQKDLGSIEPGKIADLIILNKNPLDDIRNTIEIQSVMKDGVLYDGNTLDEIWPKAKKFKLTK